MTNILTKDQVNHFLTARKKAANLTATGVLLCILSAAPLLALISFARLGSSTPSVDTMTALGVIILLIIVATGVAFLIASNRYIKSYEKLEYEDWEHSWIVWPISGIVYRIIEKLFSLKNNDIAPD